ncbi:MAG: ion channel [Pseudolabrys sp.]
MSWLRTTLVLVAVPVFNNWLLAIFAFFISPDDFTNSALNCYLTMFLACAGVATSVLGFLNRDVGPARAFLAIVLQGAALLLIFAGIYRGFGLQYGGEHQSLLSDWQSPLYFSIITWTTVGYGDFSPPAAIRMIAATQALLGYLVLGTSVGLGTYLLCRNDLSDR